VALEALKDTSTQHSSIKTSNKAEAIATNGIPTVRSDPDLNKPCSLEHLFPVTGGGKLICALSKCTRYKVGFLNTNFSENPVISFANLSARLCRAWKAYGIP
jgi:hypothetical protein